MAGIGCHSMALFMPDRATATLTHMGGEGANWLGQAPFTNEHHVFQNSATAPTPTAASPPSGLPRQPA